jgi:ubiquinone biosynthesis accessory factor UbiJ
MKQPAWIAAGVETLCNGALALDPETRARLAALADKVIAVEPLGLDIRLFFFPHAEGVTVLGQYEGDADTEIRGAPLALLRLLLSDRPADELFAGGVELRGDTATGEAFQDILRALDLDWEELLARLAGDEVAHQVGRLVRASREQTRHIGKTLEADIREYLQEEAGLLVNRQMLTEFLDAVDALRSDSDRLDARIRRLEAALAQKD